MIAISLQSGSNGNCIYVEADGVRLLFDAGISGSSARDRLAAHGRDIHSVDALIVSHEHGDHIRSAGIFHRMFGIPVCVTKKTLKRARNLGRVARFEHFRSGDSLSFGQVEVETIRTAHDVADGVAFVVTHGRKRLGILTDVGHVFDGLDDVVGSLNAVIIESNYDPGMLHNCRYPESVKARIRGPHGHISNVESAELLAQSASRWLQWACLAHLSANSNLPDVALETHRQAWAGDRTVHVAGRYGVSDVMVL